MENLMIESLETIPTHKKPFEIVERKGLGHPDTICDSVMNQISIELSKYYIKETGAVQHHNMDKAFLVAGQTENKFGGGKIIKPIKFIIGDRATFFANNKQLSVNEIAINTAKKWFSNNLRYLTEQNMDYQLEIGPTSKELQSIFHNQKSFPSNDTSVIVGYAPMTLTEQIVLNTEEYINSLQFKNQFLSSGEDVKVMGFRIKEHIDLTIAMAFVDRYVESEKQYFSQKNEMKDNIEEFLKKNFENKITLELNTLDSPGKGIDGTYLTVLGTSADGADSGEVGRGNMANRVISPCRPAGAEATAGKNPVSHIGKIYNVLSFKIANEISENLPEIDEVFVWMYNIIGRPVDKPKSIIIQPITQSSKLDKKSQKIISEIVEKNMNRINEFSKELIYGKLQVV